MEFAVFGFSAVVSALAFTAFRALIELGASRLRGALLSFVALLALLTMAWVAYRLDQAVSIAWGRSRMSGAPGSELAELIPSLGAHALVLGFMELGTSFYMVLGAAQGVVLGMAFAATSKQSSWHGAEKWKANLGRVALAVPLPAAIAAFSVFYQENRERFASIDLGGFVSLALNPAASTGSQNSDFSGLASSGRFFETQLHVQYAKGSLNGNLRARDLDYVEVLTRVESPHRRPDRLRDFNTTSAMEAGLCPSLAALHNYVRSFKDYNLLTVDIQRPLIDLQIAWHTHERELNEWADELARVTKSPTGLENVRRILAEDIGALDLASNAPPLQRNAIVSKILTVASGYELFAGDVTSQFLELGRVAERRLQQSAAFPEPDEAEPTPCPSGATTPNAAPPTRIVAKAPRQPSGRPGQGRPSAPWNTGAGSEGRDERGRRDQEGGGAATAVPGNPTAVAGRTVENRIMDLHSPYLLLGIANFYAAIGSFETAFLVSQRWLEIDRKLREASPALDEILPKWFRLRVRTEAARFYKHVPSENRSTDLYKRLVSEMARESRELVEGAGFSLKAFEANQQSANRDRCPGLAHIAGQLQGRSLEPSEDAVQLVLNLLLTVATQELERLDAVGLSGAVSQSDYDAAHELARIDFGCFARAFPERRRENGRVALEVYQWNSVAAWGRVAIRWVESGRALRRLGGEKRKEIMLTVRARLGLAVDRLEALASERAGEPGWASGTGARQSKPDPSIADDARRARRVLEEALALAL